MGNVERYLLAAEVGGTKTEVALVTGNGGGREFVAHRVYPSHDFSGIEAVIEDFLKQPQTDALIGSIAAACFSVAGPVEGGSTLLTNLGWRMDAAALSQRFGVPKVRLINDFIAAGHGIARLAPAEMEVLQTGTPKERGTRVIIGAGTGLGVGLLVWHGERYAAFPSEAGHADFAPVDEVQDRLLGYLRQNFGRVSYERVISGPGLMRIFSFLQDTGAGMPSKQLQAAIQKRGDAAEAITEFAVARLDPLAVRALDLFIAIYGSFAGNMALGGLALGGVYISGGIAPKIIGKLRDGTFVRAFNNKGRFSGLLSGIPVCVVLNQQVGLYGALMEAARLAGSDAVTK
jgi:glucokinase